MAGKKFIIKGIITLLIWFTACAVHAAEDRWIAVVLSNSEAAFSAPARSFIDSMSYTVHRFNLEGDWNNSEKLFETLNENKPSLIFALGAKAAFAAKLWTKKNQEIPVIFAMVLNWKKYNFLEGQDNIVGISSEVNPGNLFLNLSMFAPKVQKIGVISSPDYSKETVKQATITIEGMGLQLIDKSISDADDFRNAYKRIRNSIDALWIPSDPVIFTLSNMAWLKRRCIQDKIVCVGPSRNLTKMGLLLSVRPDVSNIGVQAASMAKNILEKKQDLSTIGVMAPLGTTIILNKRTANLIDLSITPRVADMATEIIE